MDMELEQTQKIVGQIYDVVTGDEEWSVPLNEITDYCDMENTALVVMDNKLQYASVTAPRADPEIITAYNNKWWEFDPTVKATRSTPVGRLTTLADTGQELFRNSVFHQDFWSRSGLGAERIATNLVLSDDAMVACVTHTSVKHDEIDHATLRRFSIFVPHLIRAAKMQRTLERASLEKALLGISASGAQIGALILSVDGRLMYANEMAERMLASGQRIGLRNGRVEFRQHEAQQMLMRTLTSLSDPSRVPMSVGPLSLDLGDQKWLVDFMPCLPVLQSIGMNASKPSAILRIQEVFTDHLPSRKWRQTAQTNTAASPRTDRGSRFEAIKQDIREHIADPDLSLAWLSERHGVSIRAIRNCFYTEQTNFTDWVMNARLDRARELLTDPGHAQTNIAAIAYESGFGDLSWFHHVFRRRFGETPAQLRARV